MPFNNEEEKQMDIAKKILVVEDDSISQRLAQLTLENMGYEVDTASTGDKALALFANHCYAAILMDVGLPDMSGIEVTYRIRELEQVKSIYTPIIALTAHVTTMVKNECLAAGMDDFTTKPLEIETLKRLLSGWIEKSNELIPNISCS